MAHIKGHRGGETWLRDCCGDSLLSQLRAGRTLRQISAGCVLSLGWEDETLCVCVFVCVFAQGLTCVHTPSSWLSSGLFVANVSFSLLLDHEMVSASMLGPQTLRGQVLSNERALPTQLLSLPLGTPTPISAAAQGRFGLK